MTLGELRERSGVTRRAIQGYEKAGLISPLGKTARGYLLYDENTLERVREIKQYQDLGFSIKEIQETIDAPDPVKLAAWKKGVLWVEGKQELIEQVKEERIRPLEEKKMRLERNYKLTDLVARAEETFDEKQNDPTVRLEEILVNKAAD